MTYIEEYKEGNKFFGIYLCKKKQALKTKAGKTYYSLLLQDKTGAIDGKVWELNNGIEDFDSMDFIMVDGIVTMFQGSRQVNISRIRKAMDGEYDAKEYMPATRYNIESMYKELIKYIDTLSEPHLRQLAYMAFVEDEEMVNGLKQHSAAKSVHHGFIGGLLQHTLSVVGICDFLAKNYWVLDRDLLITAAVFHDIGKLEEISSFPSNDYTDEGQLLGHIFIGAEFVGQLASKIPDFPHILLIELKHCILAHHGQLEYGSPKKPAIAEALALSFADNIDAKMETITEIYEKAEPSTEWIGYQKLFESNVRQSFGCVNNRKKKTI